MFQTLLDVLAVYGLPPTSLAILGSGVGAILIVYGVAGMFAPRDPILRRLSQQGTSRRRASDDAALLSAASPNPEGFMKALVPTNLEERSKVHRQLLASGFQGQHAVRNYYLLRVLLGLALPITLISLTAASRLGYLELPSQLATKLNGLPRLQLIVLIGFLVGLGFFGPQVWLHSRATERRRAIENAFPNALDLIQVSVEAGLGFDAAMIRIGNELDTTAPELSKEFLTAEREIQAGRDRNRALSDMATRTGVEEVGSFVGVVLQSLYFGTSISDVLTTYAAEMRETRELRAQEKANRLPVLMSLVMASLMLPALLIMALGPVAIRYAHSFSQ